MFSRWTWRSLWTILNSFKQNTAKSWEGRFHLCLQKPQNSLNNRHWFERKEKKKKRNCLCQISKHLSFVITPPCLTIFHSSLIVPVIWKFKLGTFCHPSPVLTCSLGPSCPVNTHSSNSFPNRTDSCFASTFPRYCPLLLRPTFSGLSLSSNSTPGHGTSPCSDKTKPKLLTSHRSGLRLWLPKKRLQWKDYQVFTTKKRLKCDEAKTKTK